MDGPLDGGWVNGQAPLCCIALRPLDVIVDGVRLMVSDKAAAASNRLGYQHRDQTAHHHKWAKVLEPIEIWFRSGSELYVSLSYG